MKNAKLLSNFSKTKAQNVNKGLSHFFSIHETSKSILKKTYVSGIQASTEHHIGNFLGSLQQWSILQQTEPNSEFYFCIADQHSLHDLLLPKPDSQINSDISGRSISTLALILATGVDPKKANIYLQSDIPMVFEIMWILNCLTEINELKRFHPKYYNKKLGTVASQSMYPFLMAADVLAIRATDVIIGKDQVENIQFAISSAKKLNSFFKVSYFPEIQIVKTKHSSIRNLFFPADKMSKSDPVQKFKINMLESDDSIKSKIIKAKTDSESTVTGDSARLEMQNLLNIFAGFRKVDKSVIVKEYEGVKNGVFKREMAEYISMEIMKIQENYQRLIVEKQFLNECLEFGKWNVLERGGQTIDDVKREMGFL